jgi:hypothetical protein
MRVCLHGNGAALYAPRVSECWEVSRRWTTFFGSKSDAIQSGLDCCAPDWPHVASTPFDRFLPDHALLGDRSGHVVIPNQER